MYDETELRQLAHEFRAVIAERIPDAAEAAAVDAAIAGALALPEGTAKTALRAALAAHPAARDFVRRRLARDDAVRILVPQRAANDTPIARPTRRRLVAYAPNRVQLGGRFAVQVQITVAEPDLGVSQAIDLDVPPQGVTAAVTVSAPTLVALGDQLHELPVPHQRDSEPVLFKFRARHRGAHDISVRAYLGGKFLGEVAAQVSVGPDPEIEEERAVVADLAPMLSEPGEVTLQVVLAQGRYDFQLMSDTLYATQHTPQLVGDPSEVVNRMVGELRAMAASTSPYATASLASRRLRNLGAELWADVVPATIRRQFRGLRDADRIHAFTVASAQDPVPWELMHPADNDHDTGFLVEQFPVVRRVFGHSRARTFRMSDAAYVVPPGSPANALDEVAAIQAQLPGVDTRGTVTALDQMHALIDRAPSLLHFACHNQFDAEHGSSITMDGGPFDPTDLAIARQTRQLERANPLVFFNACRTAGEIQGIGQMMGWASAFMAAGAGAFVGSLWAVRSSTAKAFAEAFYRELVTERHPLGTASWRARQAVMEDVGDPTWLAYTVYGNPAATVATEATA